MRNQKGEMQLYRRYVAQMTQAYNQREDIRAFVELLLTLSAIFVFSLFAIRPTLKTIGGLTQEISSKKETIQVMDQKISDIQTAQQVYNQNSSVLPLLLQAVPQEADVSSQIKQIEKITTNSQVAITQFSIQPVPLKGGELDNPGEKSVSYVLTLSGSFDGLLNSLKSIEDMRRGSLFSSQLISISDGTAQSLSITLSGEIPYYTILPN